MKQTNFNNHIFFWGIIVLLTGLLLWNVLTLVSSSSLIGFLPITIQSVLLFLIFKKHEYAKIGIKIWTLIFLLTTGGLNFFARLVEDFIKDFEYIDTEYYLKNGIFILLGMIIIHFLDETVEVVNTEKEKTTH